MTGKLIFVSGLSGAGKTTLVRAALRQIGNLSYLRTATTRPPREGEQDGTEYQFVSEEEYETARAKSAQWDHSEYQGYKYGADVAKVREQLKNGVNIICSIAPSEQILTQMKDIFGSYPITVWIDTPVDVARVRIRDDTLRSARREDTSMRAEMQHVFTPTGQLARDKVTFTELIQSII